MLFQRRSCRIPGQFDIRCNPHQDSLCLRECEGEEFNIQHLGEKTDYSPKDFLSKISIIIKCFPLPVYCIVQKELLISVIHRIEYPLLNLEYTFKVRLRLCFQLVYQSLVFYIGVFGKQPLIPTHNNSPFDILNNGQVRQSAKFEEARQYGWEILHRPSKFKYESGFHGENKLALLHIYL